MSGVSVIIPSCNRAGLLWRAVRSAAGQTVAPLEIIVVDDGSDKGVELPPALGGVPLRLHRHAENRGGAAARNTGILCARGEWVAFLDDDDEWRPDKLQVQLSLAAARGSPPNLLLSANTILRRRGLPDRPYNRSAPTPPLCEWLLGGRGSLQTSTLVLRREFASALMFDEALSRWQDWDFVLRAARQGAEIGYVHDPLAIYDSTGPGKRVSEGDGLRAFLDWADRSGALLTPEAKHLYYGRELFLSHARYAPLEAISRLAGYTNGHASGLRVTGRLLAEVPLRGARRLVSLIRRAVLRMRDLRAASRWDEWYASKIPFVWTACATAAFTSPLDDMVVLARTAATILFTCLCGGFGYVANDYSDSESDRLAGKASRVSATAAAGSPLLAAGLGAAAVGALALAAANIAAAAAGAATLVLAALYSLRPVRLKERGAAGLWSAAAAQRALPVLLAFATLDRLGPTAWSFAAVAQLAGLRAMLVHQVADAGNDRRGGVATYVTSVGEARAGLVLRRVVFPLEAAAVALAMGIAAQAAPWLWSVAVVGTAGAGLWLFLSSRIQRPWSFSGWDRQPLAFFYEAVWPAGAAALLTAYRPGLWPIAAAFLAWEQRIVRHRIANALRLVRHRLRPHRAAG